MFHVETLESLPVHSYNDIIISSARICILTIIFPIPLPTDTNLYLIKGYMFTGVRILLVRISYFSFFGLVLDLVTYCRLLLCSECIGPTACLHCNTFVRFAIVWFCLFPFPLGVWKGLLLLIVAPPGLFSYVYFIFF